MTRYEVLLLLLDRLPIRIQLKVDLPVLVICGNFSVLDENYARLDLLHDTQCLSGS